MSPNEFQLRSALREGEGERVNPDTVIARARGMQQARHDRRVRYGSVAAAVAIVGGIGVVGGLALGGGHSNKTSSAGGGGNSDRAAKQGGAVVSKPNQPIPPGVASPAAAVPCPDSPPNLALPGSGGTGQFGAHGPLFSGQVQSVKVCAYASGASGAAPSMVLTGENATDVATSMEDAAKTLPTSTKCPGGPAAIDRGSLVIIGVDKDRNPMRPVVVTLGCPTRMTNGTALRYNWTPPADITNLINQRLRSGPVGPISLPPPAKVTGSPIQS
jgi:hypothetical protein